MNAAWPCQVDRNVLSLGFHVNALCRNRFEFIGCICLWKCFLAIFIYIKTTNTIPTSPCIGGHSVPATEML